MKIIPLNIIIIIWVTLHNQVYAQQSPNLTQLTDFEGVDTDPAISPDGRWMLYSSDRYNNGKMVLWVMDLQTGKQSNFLPNMSVSSPAAWQPSGKGFLAALADATLPDQQERIRHVDFKTRTVSVPLFSAPATALQLFPTVAYDGHTVAYAMLLNRSTTDWNIYLTNTKTGNTTQLTNSSYRDLWPRFEANGKSILYFSRQDTKGQDDEIYRLIIKEQSTVRLTTSNGHDYTPHPSPNGRYIAFVSKRHKENAIYIMNSNGKNTWRLSPQGYRAGHPAWGPKSNMLYFTLRKEDGPADIYKTELNFE